MNELVKMGCRSLTVWREAKLNITDNELDRHENT